MAENTRVGALVFLGLGANMGQPLEQMRRAVQIIQSWPHCCVERVSSLYETDPVGGPQDQAKYLNAVVVLRTHLDPQALWERMRACERTLGRPEVHKRPHWGPRLIDLDLLLYDQRQLNSSPVVIPHPRMQTRAFVLVPLCELAPEYLHPELGVTMGHLLERLDPQERQGVRRLADPQWAYMEPTA